MYKTKRTDDSTDNDKIFKATQMIQADTLSEIKRNYIDLQFR